MATTSRLGYTGETLSPKQGRFPPTRIAFVGCLVVVIWALSKHARIVQQYLPNVHSFQDIQDTNGSSSSAKPRIPAHVHLIYISPGLPQDGQPPIPEDVMEFYGQWQHVHQNSSRNWKVTLWNNSMIRQHFESEIVDLLARIPILAWISDVLRILLLKELGGVYVDVDIMPFRSLDPLLDGLQQHQFPAFTVCETPFSETLTPNNDSYVWIQPEECRVTGNAVIGSVPRHPALEEMAQAVWNATKNQIRTPARILKRRMLEKTGPGQWGRIVQKHLAMHNNTETTHENNNHHNIGILQTPTFFPCHFYDKSHCQRHLHENNPGIFAMHMWAGRWTPGAAAAHATKSSAS